MISTWRFFAGAALMSGFAIAANAQPVAPSPAYTNVSDKYDCSQKLIQKNGGISNRISNTIRNNEGRSREKALIAARQALSAGYNYALMSPWERNNYTIISRTRENVFGFDVELTGEFKRSKFYLGCRGLTDAQAYDYLWGEKAEALERAGQVALLDLRTLIETLDPAANMGQVRLRQPAIDDNLFKRPGERERHLSLLPVKLAAAECFTNLGPVSDK